VSRLTDELRLLETERDDAVRVGEECARTVVKLEEMVSTAVSAAGVFFVPCRKQATESLARALKPATGSSSLLLLRLRHTGSSAGGAGAEQGVRGR
jgi:hypothetical protein